MKIATTTHAVAMQLTVTGTKEAFDAAAVRRKLLALFPTATNVRLIIPAASAIVNVELLYVKRSDAQAGLAALQAMTTNASATYLSDAMGVAVESVSPPALNNPVQTWEFGIIRHVYGCHLFDVNMDNGDKYRLLPGFELWPTIRVGAGSSDSASGRGAAVGGHGGSAAGGRGTAAGGRGTAAGGRGGAAGGRGCSAAGGRGSAVPSRKRRQQVTFAPLVDVGGAEPAESGGHGAAATRGAAGSSSGNSGGSSGSSSGSGDSSSASSLDLTQIDADFERIVNAGGGECLCYSIDQAERNANESSWQNARRMRTELVEAMDRRRNDDFGALGALHLEIIRDEVDLAQRGFPMGSNFDDYLAWLVSDDGENAGPPYLGYIEAQIIGAFERIFSSCSTLVRTATDSLLIVVHEQRRKRRCTSPFCARSMAIGM